MSLENEDRSLGCCEYINSKGRKSHLFQLFCDCNELDEYSESLLTHTEPKVEKNTLSRVLSLIEDRLCRFPFPGGARKITKDFLLPAFCIPTLLFGIPSLFQNVVVCFILYWGILIGLLITWYMWYRRTKIFLFSITIVQFLHLWIYEYYLVGIVSYSRIISFQENFFLLLLFFACLGLVFTIRICSSKNLVTGQVRGSTYCKICGAHVPGRDHHCIWLDACISAENSFAFYTLLILCVVYLFDYALIGLSSICHPFYKKSPVLVPSSNCHLDNYANLMICLGCLNACFIAIPIVGLCI